MSLSLGLLEWFRPGEEDRVEQVLQDLDRLGVTRLRTGISWAEYHTPAGAAWYQWLFPRLAARVEILPCFLYTPPSLGIRPKVSSPPKVPRAYADWLDEIITRYGACFEYVELWNEPNNLSEWDWTLDPNWLVFCEMIGAAAYWARQRGKKTVLGGMAPVDPQWLAFMIQRGVIEHIDVVGVHAFPALWETNWPGWEAQLQPVRDVLAQHNCKSRVWITETGYSTWRHDEFGQVHAFLQAIEAPAERIYWYAVHDLDPDNGTVDGFHTDEREYHLGLKGYNARPKLLYSTWVDGGLANVRALYDLGRPQPRLAARRRPVLVTGGAGFIGAKLAARLADQRRPVIIYDNLSRPAADLNLRRLKTNYGPLIDIRIADVRDFYTLRDTVCEAETVFHLAAEHSAGLGRLPPEFETNLRGTINLLEAVRSIQNPPALVTASTAAAKYSLDPYCTSRAAADRYVQTYAKSFQIPAVVLRFGTIYGLPLPGLAGETIATSNGHATFELLHVDDAVNALLAAETNLPQMHGRLFDITGGESNRIAPADLARLLKDHSITPHFAHSENCGAGVSPARVGTPPAALLSARCGGCPLFASTPDPPLIAAHCGAGVSPAHSIPSFQHITGWRPRPFQDGLSDIARQALAVDVSTPNNNQFEKGGHRARSRG